MNVGGKHSTLYDAYKIIHIFGAKSVRILDLLSASYAGNSAYFEAFDDYSIFPAAFHFN